MKAVPVKRVKVSDEHGNTIEISEVSA